VIEPYSSYLVRAYNWHKLVGARQEGLKKGVPIVDGDLFPITKLKSLNKISYQNRRHYSHKREDFGKLYA
jgi:hypothetical protein